MKKKLFFAIAVCTSIAYTNAQVGINTTDPKTTLHVIGTNDNGAVAATDGVLVPRVNALAVNGTENGQLVFLIADAGTFTKGFHYWDGAAWVPITDAEAIAGTAEIRKVTGGNIISSEAGTDGLGLAISAGAANEDNIAIGRNAGSAQTSGTKNILIGLQAGNDNVDGGSSNVYIGDGSGKEAGGTNNNVAIGANAFRDTDGTTSGSNTVAIGGSSLNGATINGGNNVAIGRNSGSGATFSGNTSFFGTSAGQGATMTSNNTLLGSSAGSGSTLASGNTFVGRATGSGATFANENTFIGIANGLGATSVGNQNASLGSYQLRNGSAGNLNVFVGPAVFSESTVGSANIAIGQGTGSDGTYGSGNILFGQGVASTQTLGSNNIAIGNLIEVPAVGGATPSNTLTIQNIIFGVGNDLGAQNVAPDGKIGIGQPDPQERLDVDGTSKANNFRQNIEATTTVNKTKGIILANANFSMPAATEYTGLTITVRNIGTTGITFNGGNRTINGVTTNTRVIPVGNTFRFTSDGTNWYIISQL